MKKFLFRKLMTNIIIKIIKINQINDCLDVDIAWKSGDKALKFVF
jgi:hypothetical protein